MKLTGFALKRPVTTLMVFVSFIVTGAIASRMLPLEYFPEVQFPGIFIQIPYPNATADEIERLITRPAEEVLATMSGIKAMNSETTDNAATIFIRFDWDKEVKLMGMEAREKLDAIRGELPADIQRIFVFTGSTADMPLLELRISSSRNLENAYDLLDRKLKRPIEVLPGVSKVMLYGVDKQQIHIKLDPARVAAHQIDLNELSRKLSQYNFSLTAGEITDSDQRYRVKPYGEFRDIDEIRNLVIGPGNLRLRDISVVELDQPTPQEGRHLGQTFAVGMNVQRESTANLVETTYRVLDLIAEVEQDPEFAGIKLFAMDNQALGIESSLRDISLAGLTGFFLSLVVLYFFLRQVTVTAIVALAVPFSLTITIAFMFFAGLSLNILSMMGLMLAVGMLVDNAVVITESIFRQQELNPDNHRKAIMDGVKEVGLAVTAGTITTAIVFLPNIIGVKTNITIFLSHVAITICIALVASLFIALTIIPLLLSRLKPRANGQKNMIHRLSARYGKMLGWTLRHPRWSGLLAVLILVSIAVPMGVVKKDMWEEEGKRRLFLPYNIDGQYSIERIEQTVTRIETFLYAHQEELDIEDVYSYYTNSLAQSTLLLKDDDNATKSVTEIREFIEENMPKIAIGSPSFDRDRAGNSDGLKIYVQGDSTEVLVDLSQEAARILSGSEGLNAQSEAASRDQELQVVLDRDRALNLGFDPEQVGQMISVAMRGQDLRTFRDENGETDIRLEFGEEARKDLDSLKKLPLFRPGQDPVPLASIASFNVKRAANRIQRENRVTSVGVEITLDDVTVDEAKEVIDPLMNAMQLPDGYTWSYGRGFDHEDETGAIMMTNMILALMMIYLVMAALFESLLFPSAVIFAVFYSVVGVFWFFMITGTTLSFMALIGILVLMGVVVNNGIVLIDHINHLRATGMPRNEAIIQAGQDRLRPILMTAGTTILGLVPLSIGDTTIGGEVDSPPYFPMARAVIGGLAFSTVVSLLVLPTIYAGLDNLSRWSSRVKHTALARRDRVFNRS